MPTNPHWVRVVGYGPFSLCVIHKEGLCPSSGDINRLMMMNKLFIGLIINTTYITSFTINGNGGLYSNLYSTDKSFW
jgi:hypothetical protein